MITRAIKWFASGSIVLLVTAVVAVLVAVGTQSGTQFLFHKAAEFFPDELQVGDVRGTLASSLRIENVTWSDQTADITVAQAELELGFRYLISGILRIEKVRVADVTVRLKPSQVPASDEPFSLQIPAIIDVAGAEVINLRVLADQVENTVEYVLFAGRLQGKKLTVRRLSLRAGDASARLDGRLELHSPYSVQANVDWSLAGSPAGRVAGAGAVTGTINDYEVRHSLTAPYKVLTTGSIQWADTPVFDVHNSWTNLAIPVGENDELVSKSGELRLAGSTDQFRFDVTANTRLLDGSEAVLIAGGTGNTESLTLQAIQLSAADAQAGAADAIDLSSTGSMHVTREGVTFRELTILEGGNRLTLNGGWAEELNLRARISAPRLGRLLPGFKGALSGTFAASGSLETPIVNAELTAEQLSYAGMSADVITLRSAGASTLNQSIKLNALDVSVGVGGIQLDDVSIALEGGLPAHAISLAGGVGAKRFDIQAQAGYVTNTWSGSVQSVEIRAGGNEHWVASDPANFLIDSVRQSISLLCLQNASEARLCAEFSSSANEKTQTLSLAIETFPLGALIEKQEPQLLASGSFSGDLRMNKVRGDYSGVVTGRIGSLDLGLRPSPDIDDLAPPAASDLIKLGLEFGGAVELNRLTLGADLSVNGTETATGKLSVADVRDLNSQLQASLSATLGDVGFISWFLDQVDIEGGRLDANISVAGTALEPLFMGNLNVADASIFIPATNVSYKNVRLNVNALDTTVINFDATADSADGQLQLSGNTRVDMNAGWPTTLSITGEDVEILRFPEGSVFASPDLKLLANSDSATLSGTIVVPRATIVLDKVPDTAQSPSPDAVVHISDAGESAEVYGYDVDVTLNMGSDVKLTGFGLDAYLEGGLDLTGGLRKPFRGNGELSLREGKFDAYGQALSIDRGLIIFSGRLDNPLLDIRATRDIDAVSVGILLTGPADEPQSTLFSNPVMSQASILSYLITGQPLPEAGGEDSERISGAAIALGLSQANSVISEVSGTLGLDELSLDGGSSDGRILAGKRLGSRLYVRYAYGVFDRVGNLLLRYRLSDQFSIESKSGEEQSLDLIYSIELD